MRESEREKERERERERERKSMCEVHRVTSRAPHQPNCSGNSWEKSPEHIKTRRQGIACEFWRGGDCVEIAWEICSSPGNFRAHCPAKCPGTSPGNSPRKSLAHLLRNHHSVFKEKRDQQIDNEMEDERKRQRAEVSRHIARRSARELPPGTSQGNHWQICQESTTLFLGRRGTNKETAR